MNSHFQAISYGESIRAVADMSLNMKRLGERNLYPVRFRYLYTPGQVSVVRVKRELRFSITRCGNRAFQLRECNCNNYVVGVGHKLWWRRVLGGSSNHLLQLISGNLSHLNEGPSLHSYAGLCNNRSNLAMLISWYDIMSREFTSFAAHQYPPLYIR